MLGKIVHVKRILSNTARKDSCGSGVLKNQAIGKEVDYSNAPALRHFSRKELIEIIKKRFGGTIPKEHNLMEMENEELITLVGNQMFIIAYMTDKWSKQPKLIQSTSSKNTPPEKPKKDEKKK